MRVLRLVPLAAVLVMASGCATLFTGTSDTISFNSEPDGADVMIDGFIVGQTPVTLPVKRSLSGKTVTMSLDGYNPVTFQLSNTFNIISVLNLSNIIGWGVDAVTGAVMKYDRPVYTVDLDRGSVAHNIQDLETTEDGALIVPVADGPVTVVDEAAGIGIVFTNE